MNQLPSFESYGKHESDNYGVNTLKIYVGNMTIYYSYRTIIAFHTYTRGLVVSKNIYSATTGKHLNWIDGGAKHKRLNRVEFEKQLQEAVKEIE